MDDQTNSLKNLIKKYQADISNLEKEINNLREKQNVAEQALVLLESEGMSARPLLDMSAYERKSNLYGECTLKDATIDILRREARYLTRNEIVHELRTHGYKTKSANLKRDVSVLLSTLNKLGTILRKQRANDGIYTYGVY